MTSRPPSKNSSHDGRDPRVVCTGWLHIITSIILSRSSRTPPQGISSPSSRLLLPSLQILVSDLQLPRTKVVLPSWYLEDATTLLRRALLLIGLLKGDLDPPLFFESLQFVSWWRCEGTTTAGGVLENCRDIRDGDEVVACGRVSRLFPRSCDCFFSFADSLSSPRLSVGQSAIALSVRLPSPSFVPSSVRLIISLPALNSAHQRAHWQEHRETCWEPIW